MAKAIALYQHIWTANEKQIAVRYDGALFERNKWKGHTKWGKWSDLKEKHDPKNLPMELYGCERTSFPTLRLPACKNLSQPEDQPGKERSRALRIRFYGAPA